MCVAAVHLNASFDPSCPAPPFLLLPALCRVSFVGSSINVKSDDFVSNADSDSCVGHKWGTSALWKYLKANHGVDTDKVWKDMCDIIVKTIMASDGVVSSSVKANVAQRSCVHELFGFDVMLDNNLKPSIIEVNISPSLHSASQLDRDIKGRLLRDVFNLAGFRLPIVDALPASLEPGAKPNKPSKPSKSTDTRRASSARSRNSSQSTTRKSITSRTDPKDKASTSQSAKPSGYDGGISFMGTRTLTASEKSKHTHYLKHPELADTIIDHLTDDDILMLMETEAENARRGEMERLLPSPGYGAHLQYVCPNVCCTCSAETLCSSSINCKFKRADLTPARKVTLVHSAPGALRRVIMSCVIVYMPSDLSCMCPTNNVAGVSSVVFVVFTRI